MAKGLVEVVHLGQNADCRNNYEGVRRRMRELVVAAERQFQSDSEGLDRHDGYRAHRRADGNVYQWVFLAIHRANFVNHNK